MIIDVYIGDYKLDLFKDEGIELNSSVATINDITKNTTEYTKSFTVPASDINNQIFKHYYNANIDNTFDARTKVTGRIELNGIPFKFGKWKLEKVAVKQLNPSSYTINFTGNLVNLKDKFKDDKIGDLDLSAFDHLSNSTNVKQGLTSSLFSGNVIYNLFAKRQLYFKGLNTDNANTEKLVNIAYAGGSNTGISWSELKPSIKISKIIEAIESKYNINFSNDFFSRAEFTNIFMWLNKNIATEGTPTEQLINFTNKIGDELGFNLTTDVWTNAVTGVPFVSCNYSVKITTTQTTPYQIVVKNNGVEVAVIDCNGGNFQSNTLSVPFGAFNYKFYIRSSNSITYTSELKLRRSQVSGATITTNSSTIFAPSSSLVVSFNISANLPDLKVLEFLKGLFQMFKLVVIADEYDNIYVNTLTDYYASGRLYNLTRYTDFSSYDVERGNILNTIKFNFQDPETLLNSQFKINTGLGYGDEELILEDEDGKLLDGDSLEVEIPFEQVIYERLNDLQDGLRTNIQYAGIFDDKIEAVNPKAILFYNSLQNLGTKSVGFRNQSNVKEQLSTLNVPSHSFGFENPQFSLLFSEEFSTWNGQIITNNLYSNYYRDYINAIFNIKRRTFKFNCKNIPFRIMTKLKLNDVIQIKNDYYRIDNYNFNLITGETSFNLINSFDNTIGAFKVSNQLLTLDYTGQVASVYVTNLDNFDYTSTETWVTATNIGNLVYFDVAQNSSGATRVATVTIINTATLQEVEVIIIQSDGNIRFDNNVIRYDNNLITFDNL